MNITTFRFAVEGDDIKDLGSKAEFKIAKLIDADYTEADFFKKFTYELTITENNDISADCEYTADVVARIKDVGTK